MSLDQLHSSIFHPTLRLLQESDVQVGPQNFMYPVFVIEDDNEEQSINSMPGIQRYGVNRLIEHLTVVVKKGLKSVLIFGVIEKLPKNKLGTSADSAVNPVIRALPKLRQAFPNLLIAVDVCLCPYTDHGHCGIPKDGTIDNAASIKRIAEISLQYAIAGAHIIAPSDMNDNRILAIKNILRENQFGSKVSVLSYSAKFASCFYGPFRDAAKSAPSTGDRKSYQLPPGSSALAARAAKRDVEQGADMIMVKPGLPYLDIVRQTKDAFPHIPMFIYQVSGEYAMLYYGAKSGAISLESALLETVTSMRRAGADCIITYFTPMLLDLTRSY